MNGVSAYSEAQSDGREARILENIPLVKRIAYHLLNRLPPSVQLDDLIQAGVIGLIEAAKNFDPTQGASFETYAGIRIRGSMIDEIRKSDWTPRSVHRKARQVSEVVREIEHRTGCDAKDAEVAETLGISLDDYHHILQDVSSSKVFSLDELQESGERGMSVGRVNLHDPLSGLQTEGFKQTLVDAIKGLPEREQLVISLYYDDELNLREIGEVLGVSESRVCQIHSQAVIRIRARMGDWVAA